MIVLNLILKYKVAAQLVLLPENSFSTDENSENKNSPTIGW